MILSCRDKNYRLMRGGVNFTLHLNSNYKLDAEGGVNVLYI